MLICKTITQSYRHILFFAWLLFSATHVFSQAKLPVVDTPAVLIDTFKVVVPDSLLTIPLDSAQILKKETRSKKTKKLSKLFSYLRYKDKGQRTDFSGVEKYKPYKGKKIQSITIEIFKPFGDPKDTTEQLGKAEIFANKIHSLSKDWYVSKDILFKEGDKVNPNLFADTEKLLWDRRKFKNIEITLTEDSTTHNVNVNIMLQDNLSWIVGLGYNGRLIAGISTYNFFGHPHTFSVFAGVNFNKYNLWAVGGDYKYENIKASQVNFNTKFLAEKLNRQAFVSLNRNFFSINSKWAFDVKYSYEYLTRSLTGKRLDIENFRKTRSNAYSVWVAYALPVTKIFPIKDDKLKLVFATKIDNVNYGKRPFISSPVYDKVFVDQQNYKFGIGVARWDYYLIRNTFYIETAEYLPRGYSASLWVGYQNDEVFKKRISLDFTVNYGIHIEKVGYFYPQYNFTGYVKNKKGEQLINKISVDYVSNKANFAKFVYFRQIVKLVTKLGSEFPEARYFNINDVDGIRGFYSPPLRGSKSVAINLEADFFIDKKIAYAKTVHYVFCDLAWLSQNNKKLFTQSVFQYGVGFGIRVRSATLGLPFVDMQLGFYPRGKNFGEELIQFKGYGNNPNAIRQNNMLVE
jgi:hypothetical protein